MTRYLLDTDVVSQASKERPSGNVAAWLASVDDQDLAISVIALRERLEGAEKAKRNGSPQAANIAADIEDMVVAYEGRILPIDEDGARRWAKL